MGGCVSSLPPMHDVSPLLYCTNPYHCAYARFLGHDENPEEDNVDIKYSKDKDERVYHLESNIVTELCWQGFRQFRQKTGVSDEDFFFSLVGEESLRLESNSRGGSYFSRTHDLKYIVKEIKDPEIAHLKRISKSLFEHWENNPNSLLNRIYAAFTIQSPGSRSRPFVIIENSFPHDFSHLETEYDLKGAKGGNRQAKKNERTMKDLDFQAKYSQGMTMSFEDSSRITTALQIDTLFLRDWLCTDYSLLVSVYKDGAEVEVEEENFHSPDLGRVRVCIIDYLREFDNAKRRESTVKNMFRNDASVQNPTFYQKRFLRAVLPTSPNEPVVE